MNTREFIRIQLDASAATVRTWLASVAVDAERLSGRSFCMATMDISQDASKSETLRKSGTLRKPKDSSLPMNNTAEGEEAGLADKKAEAGVAVSSRHHRRRYGIFDGKGALVVDASMFCPTPDTTVLELRRDEAFPLVANDLLQQLGNQFPVARGEALVEKPRARIGAPPLACNVWLEEQLRQLPDPSRHHHLYASWLAHYRTLRGYEPQDPRRSFRAAVAGCLKRIGQGDGV